jgi:hypothetical protein
MNKFLFVLISMKHSITNFKLNKRDGNLSKKFNFNEKSRDKKLKVL